MSLVLEVHAPPVGDPNGANVTHTYGGVELLQAAPSFVSEYELERVTMPNAELSTPVFLGATDYFGLPEGDWRARVLFNGVEVLNGRARRFEIERDDVSGKFVVAVTDDATERAKALLGSVRLDNLPEAQYQALSWHAMQALIPYEFKPNTTRTGDPLRYMKPVQVVRAYKLLDVVQQVHAAAGLLGAPAALWDFRVRVTDNGNPVTVTRRAHDSVYIYSLQGYRGEWNDQSGQILLDASQYSRNSLTLPTWDGWKLIEAVNRLCGWTLRASYGVFPSEQITVEQIGDLWDDGAALPDVGALWDSAKFTLRRAEPWKPDLAVQYSRVDELPEIFTWGTGHPHVTTDAPELDQFYTPPPFAVSAASTWNFGGGREPEGETVSLPFSLANCGRYGDDGWRVITSQQSSGVDGNQVTEDVVIGRAAFASDDDKRAYIAELDTLTNNECVVLHRRVYSAAPGQLPYACATWASAVFQAYELSRAERDVIEGTLLADGTALGIGDLVAGPFSGGFAALGRKWITERVERLTGKVALGVRGARPVDLPDRASDQPFYVGPVTALKGRFVDVENAINPEKEYHRVSWDYPLSDAGRAILFQVERYNFSSSAWESVTPFIYGRRIFDFNRSSGNDTFGERHSKYRVRASMIEANGLPSTNGPWTELSIYH